MKVLITGAGGFVGSAFVRRVLKTTDWKLKALVRRSNDRRLQARLLDVLDVSKAVFTGRLEVVYGDLLHDISGMCEGCDAVVHSAARTFVDHSILDPLSFVESNIVGTYRMLEDARRHGVKRFIHVSTDEVYGAILRGQYSEDAPLNPSNPYAASKAAADCLTLSYAKTYGMHTIVTRTENNYGPFQHPQKAFPVFVKHAIAGEPLPVYGDGSHVRQWLWVDDHVDALKLLLTHADVEKGGIYHVAGEQELPNLELARRILKLVGKSTDQIKFIDDSKIRPGHDKRYALNSDKIRTLGWQPKMSLDNGIAAAVDWYSDCAWWNR